MTSTDKCDYASTVVWETREVGKGGTNIRRLNHQETLGFSIKSLCG